MGYNVPSSGQHGLIINIFGNVNTSHNHQLNTNLNAWATGRKVNNELRTSHF